MGTSCDVGAPASEVSAVRLSQSSDSPAAKEPATAIFPLTCALWNVRYWHIADVQLALKNVCFEGNNGHTRT